MRTPTTHRSGHLARPRALTLAAMLPVAVLFAAAAALAAPTVLDPTGLPVCAATGNQYGPRAVPAADGAAIVVWMDRRRGETLTDIYALSVAADGSVTPGWPDDGLLLCGSGTASAPIPVPDGAGGALVLWMDSRQNPPYPDVQIFGQRVGPDGVIAPGWPADGKAITGGGPYLIATKLFDAVPDGAGGAYFARASSSDFGEGTRGVVSRITADGVYASGWSQSGLAYGRGSAIHRDAAIAGELDPDPGAGVFFTLRWTQGPVPEVVAGATLARISSGGAQQWSLSVPTHWSGDFTMDGIRSISTAADGSGGCYAAWHDGYQTPTGWRDDEFMQRYSPPGAPQWAADTPAPAYRVAESDGSGGVFLVGGPAGSATLAVHRRLPDGGLPEGWSASGLTIATPAALGAIARGAFHGDLFLAWSEVRTSGSSDLRAIAVDPSGAVESGWAADGTIVSDEPGEQSAPAAAAMSPTRALVCWQDSRTGSWDIRAARIDIPAPTLGVPPAAAASLSLGAPWPNPARGMLRFDLSVADAGEAVLEVLDVGGRAVRRIGSVAPGVAARRFEVDVRDLANGVYWLRLSQGGRSESRRFAVLD